jgi:ATP-binding cassette subfamily B protein/subfamily B ATP-binding cassette protein MsbA
LRPEEILRSIEMVKIFKRLLTYSYRYKGRLIAGIFLSFLVAVFNGASLTSMVPIFDSMGNSSSYRFQLSMTKRDLQILEKKKLEPNLRTIEFIEWKIANSKIKLNNHFASLSADQIVLLFVSLVFPIYILKLICLGGAIYFINSTGSMAIRDLRLEIYQKVQTLPLNFFVKEKTGILMSRIINDVDSLGKVISGDLKDAILDFFYIVTHLLLLLILSWKMFFLVFFVIPVIMGPISAFTEKIRKATKNQQERLSALNGHLQEMIAGIRVIRAFGMEKKESSKFGGINQELMEKTFQGHFYHQVGPSIIELFGSIIASTLLAFGAYLIANENFSKGMFLAFFMTLVFVIRPLKQMSMMINLINSAVAAGERVFEILDSKTEIQNKPNPLELPTTIKEIKLDHVIYTYPGSQKPALNDIDLSIQKGETIAFVGPSGGGKSTLKDLLSRMIDPSQGNVLFDGNDIREYDLGKLRSKIGVVSQDVFLFNGTVRENITLGNAKYTEGQLVKAAEDACALEFINSLEFGFETPIGENGVMLSGGQRQRISIARGILANPEILILDEATSALDNESERMVQTALEHLYKNRTTIIIAHRLSTIQIANRIYYLEEGKIVENGTHEELIKLGNKYKNLYDYQFTTT